MTKFAAFRLLGRVLVLVGSLLIAIPAQATPVTLSFSGTVNLSAFGGPAANTFSGSGTWNTSEPPLGGSTPTEGDYDLVSYHLVFNGVDVTQPILGNGVGSGINVLNDSTFAAPAIPVTDAFVIYAEFPVLFTLPGGGHTMLFTADIFGPTSMFSSTALPPNLNFLAQSNLETSAWLEDLGGSQRFLTLGKLNTVPEPTTLVLTGLGLAGQLARRRRPRTQR